MFYALFVVDAEVGHDVEVLRLVLAFGILILDGVDHAGAFHRLLLDAVHILGLRNARQFVHGRGHVDDMVELAIIQHLRDMSPVWEQLEKRETNGYSEQVMDHFSNSRNVGKMEDANGVGEVGNAKCGVIMKMYLKIEDNKITDVKFNTFGCGAAIATSSMATEMIKGKSVDEALQLTSKAVMEALGGLPPVKVHCSVLAEEAVKAAVAGCYQRQGKEPPQEAEFGPCCCGDCGS